MSKKKTTNKNLILKHIILSGILSVISCQPYSFSQERDNKTQPSMQSKQQKREWKAASFKGLTIGKSTRADMLRVFGKPNWSGSPEGQSKNDPQFEEWNEYGRIGEFLGELTVVINKQTGIILEIIETPENLSEDEAVAYFGSDFIITRYDADECLDDGGAMPIFESPTGSTRVIEYRERGIAITLSNKKVVDISYVSKPIGSPTSRCKNK